MLRNSASFSLGVLTLLACGALYAAEDDSKASAQVTAEFPLPLPALGRDELSRLIKENLLTRLLPEFVFRSENNWGHQAHIPSIQGFKVIEVLRNHGDWEQVKVDAKDVPQHLEVRVGELCYPKPGRVVFTTRIVVPAQIQLRKQVWQNGLKVYSSHVRARFRLAAELTMAVVLAPADGSTPTVTAVQLVRESYSCNHFVAEDINGLGGDGARLLEGSVEYLYKPWQPGALAEFHEWLQSALTLTRDTPEVHAGLDKVLLGTIAARKASLEEKAPEPPNEVVPGVVGTACPLAEGSGPLVSGSIKVEIGARKHADSPPRRAHEDHSSFFERLGLSDHTIHFEHSESSGHSESHDDSRKK